MIASFSSPLASISAAVSIGAAIGFSMLLLILPRRPALRAWAASLWLWSAAVYMRQSDPTLSQLGPSVVFAAFALCGGVLLLQGVSLHVRRPLPVWKPVLVLAPLLVAMLLDGLVCHVPGLQRALSCLWSVVLYSWLAWMLLRQPPTRLRMSYYVAAFVFAAHVAHGIYGLGVSPDFSAATQHHVTMALSQRMSAGIVLLIAQCSALMLLLVEQLLCELNERASHDGLTGLLNRSALLHAGRKAMDAARASDRPFALLVLDLDYFKRINDNWGHLVGDEVLCHFAIVMRACAAHPGAVLARYGGEEFIMLLPGADASVAMQTAHSTVQAVRAASVPTQAAALHYTVSIGVAVADRTCTLQQLISRADVALYHAKANGRDRACIVDGGYGGVAAGAVRSPDERGPGIGADFICVKGA